MNTIDISNNSAATHIQKFISSQERFPRAAIFALQAVAREILGDSRMGICCRYRSPGSEVSIWHNREAERAYYCGLMRCGMAWVCPLCSSRLSEKRRIELRAALDNARDLYLPVFVTYTLQHSRADRLDKLVEAMTFAYRSMRQQRLWRVLKEEYMIAGEVRTFEITHGDSGWHPHFHTLIFLEIKILDLLKEGHTWNLDRDLHEPLRNHLTPMWIAALQKVGYTAQDGPGLHVRGEWSQLDDYMTKGANCLPKVGDKWTAAEEMTKQQRKRSRGDSINVWDMLLRHYAGMPGYDRLFLEFYHATKGRSMMQWTPGMLSRLKVDHASDETITQQVEPDQRDVLLLMLPVEVWRLVLEREAQGRLLDESAKGNVAAIVQFLERIGVVLA